VSADMIVADMHFGYYVQRTMVERLRSDLIVPAWSGYSDIVQTATGKHNWPTWSLWNRLLA
jgi:hypothetical protein